MDFLKRNALRTEARRRSNNGESEQLFHDFVLVENKTQGTPTSFSKEPRVARLDAGPNVTSPDRSFQDHGLHDVPSSAPGEVICGKRHSIVHRSGTFQMAVAKQELHFPLELRRHPLFVDT